MRGHYRSVNSVAVSPDSRRIVSGSSDFCVQFWDARTGLPIGNPLQGHHGVVFSVAFSGSGRYVASASGDCTIRLWDASSALPVPVGDPLQGHSNSVTCVAFSPDSKQIVSGSLDCTIRRWDTETGLPIGTPLQVHKGGLVSVAFVQAGSRSSLAHETGLFACGMLSQGLGLGFLSKGTVVE